MYIDHLMGDKEVVGEGGRGNCFERKNTAEERKKQRKQKGIKDERKETIQKGRINKYNDTQGKQNKRKEATQPCINKENDGEMK